MTRTFGTITDIPHADLWVMDPKVQYIDDVKPMRSTQILRVRGVEGVAWAMPLYKGVLKARLSNGTFQTVNLLGLDDTTLLGGPPEMVQGRLEDLRRADGVIVDAVGAAGKLAKPAATPGGKPTPLVVGDTLELNDHRAVVVGICRVSRTFQSQPVVFTTFSRATAFAPRERLLLSFLLVKAKPGVPPDELATRISSVTGLAAHTRDSFRDLTVRYFMRYTGIPINFGTAVLLGFLVGTAIAGQTFYNFTLENLRQFGALKAMGASDGVCLRMILLQSALVGFLGYGLGVGAASLFGTLFRDTELAFRLPWQLLAGSAAALGLITALAALLSIRKVVRLEPAIVFKG
jgi:putative ABC transport system permease protein